MGEGETHAGVADDFVALHARDECEKVAFGESECQGPQEAFSA